MTPLEIRTINQLETKWRADARKMPSKWPMRWTFVRQRQPQGEDVIEARGRDEMVALCEIIESDQPMARVGMDGVPIRPELWKLATDLNSMTKLPLMVVVIAADGTFWAKVDSFTSVGETRRLRTPDFRPL